MSKELLSLSERGRSLASNPARIDFEIFMEAMQNLYCPDTNKEGAFPLNIAENAISTSIIQNKLNTINQGGEIPDWVMKYTDPKGNNEVRERVAHFMENHLCGCPIDPDALCFAAGASAIIEITSFALANSHDIAVIPAPAYTMYSNDMGVKSEIERFDLQTHFNIEEIGSQAPVKVSMLEKAKKDIEAAGKCFKILLITSPDNPTGCVYDLEQLNLLSDWCIQNEVHMIVNEIYGLSLIDTSADLIKEDYTSPTQFQSFANIIGKKKSPFLHLWYAFSKDFAMSGLRFGVLYSLNESLIKALENVNVPHMVSNHTQWMIGEMLSDDTFVKEYIAENKKRLNKSYLLIASFLKEMGIHYIPSRGSLFIWADFSKYLKEDSEDGQEQLWIDIYKNTGALLTPGMGFQHEKNGMFRIVFTAVSYEYLTVALDRMKAYFNKIN